MARKQSSVNAVFSDKLKALTYVAACDSQETLCSLLLHKDDIEHANVAEKRQEVEPWSAFLTSRRRKQERPSGGPKQPMWSSGVRLGFVMEQKKKAAFVFLAPQIRRSRLEI